MKTTFEGVALEWEGLKVGTADLEVEMDESGFSRPMPTVNLVNVNPGWLADAFSNSIQVHNVLKSFNKKEDQS